MRARFRVECQLAKSYRELSMGPGICLGKLDHLGMEDALKSNMTSFKGSPRNGSHR